MESKCKLKESKEYKECRDELTKIFEQLLCNTSENNIMDTIEKNILKYKKNAS